MFNRVRFSSFRPSNTLRRLRRSSLYENIFLSKIIEELLALVFAILIRSNGFNTMPSLNLYFVSKFYEYFQEFRIVHHKIYLSLVTKVISNTYEV
jgi:hypothetical protein